jgi:ectoine hydroxylase-related dioxygenase (phytanoyl-CoA dioxygenase family)
MMTLYSSDLERDGISAIADVLSEAQCDALAAELATTFGTGPGSRLALKHAQVAALGNALLQHRTIALYCGNDYLPVQCTYFDKSERSNWLVAWHQDLSMPVRDQVSESGFTSWQKKEGLWFAQPPDEVLQAILIVRISLDGCDEQNGALHVIPGSHHMGRVQAIHAASIAAKSKRLIGVVKKGDAMLMRPLVLHASSKSASDRQRRVLHYVFAPSRLLASVEWATTVNKMPA